MARFLAGAAACLLLVTGAFLLWQGRAEQAPALPPAPPASGAPPSMVTSAHLPQAPEATPKSREQKRFSRADKDKDGKIAREELLGPRRKAFAKLDTNGNGALSFEEWGVKTLTKFAGADSDRTGWLTPAEYAATAPPPPKKKAKCGC
ncbi:MAG: EF-hand domain-containing protein [Sphingomicrobium sp.]